MKRDARTGRRDLLLIGGAVVLATVAAALVAILGERTPQRSSCRICQQLAEAKALHEAGRISELEWVRHRLEALNHDWTKARLPLLREREALLAERAMTERGTSGDLFETRFEIESLRE